MNSRTLFGPAAVTLLWPLLASAIPEGPAYPSVAWTQREAQNYAIVSQAPLEQTGNPAFTAQWQAQSLANQQSWLARAAADSSWLAPASGNTPLTPVCTQWTQLCTGDPFRYAGTDPFYLSEGETAPVVFYDSACARLSGRIWKPLNIPANIRLPGVIIETGSIAAPETLYWWAAQTLVRAGYVVMTFDVRGQGRSDFLTPSGGAGSDIDPTVFWTDLVDAIDFFRSSPQQVYPNNKACAGSYPTVVNDFNPDAAIIDAARLGLAGHSSGATGVSVVQGYGGAGAQPWPGKIDKLNPVKVVVAWDGLFNPDGSGGGGANGTQPAVGAAIFPNGTLPKFAIRVPALDLDSEYGIDPVPYISPPDPEGNKLAYAQWRAAGVPVFGITIRGSTHFDFSLLPGFPASSWCPQIQNGECSGGWGIALAQHYTVAWLDRWLKLPGEPGYADADQRLLDDNGPQGRVKMSFYSRSARSFPDREGAMHHCEDIRAGCTDMTVSSTVSGSGAGSMNANTLVVMWLLFLLNARARTLRRNWPP
ncbi:MAG: alpha/beta hydrolase family protein [Stenotrophobium sp.]